MTDPTTLSLADLAAAPPAHSPLPWHFDADGNYILDANNDAVVWLDDALDGVHEYLLAAANRLPGVVEELAEARALVTIEHGIAETLRRDVEVLKRDRDRAVMALDTDALHVYTARLARDEARQERDSAIARVAAAEGKLRETTYAALAAREQGEADTVARIVAWLDDPEGEPISHEMLRGYGLQDYSQRVETCRDMFAEMIKAGAWRGKEQA